MNETIRLIDENGYPVAVLRVTERAEHHIRADVELVAAWRGLSVAATEPYLHVCIKWDGCCHLNFGRGVSENRSGYLHFCEVEHWKRHCQIMEWTFKELSRLFKHEGGEWL